LLRQPTREIHSRVNGLVIVATGLWPVLLSTAHRAVATAVERNSGAFRAGLPSGGALAQGNPRCFFSIRHLHKLIEIKRAATFGSHFSKFNLIPAVHTIYLVTFLPDAHWFARNHAMDDFFVFGPWPAPHSAASPIDSMSDIVIAVWTPLEIEKWPRVSREHRGDVLQCVRIANPSNLPAKRQQSFRCNR